MTSSPSRSKDRLDLYREVLVSPSALSDAPLTAAEEVTFPIPVLSLPEAANNARRKRGQTPPLYANLDRLNASVEPEECAIVGRVVRDSKMVVIDKPFVEHPFKKRKKMVMEELDGSKFDLQLLGEYAVQMQNGMDKLEEEGDDKVLFCIEGPVIGTRRRKDPRRTTDEDEEIQHTLVLGLKGAILGERRPRIVVLKRNTTEEPDNSSQSIIPDSQENQRQLRSSGKKKGKGKGKNRPIVSPNNQDSHININNEDNEIDEDDDVAGMEAALREVVEEVNEVRTRQSGRVVNPENIIPEEALPKPKSPVRPRSNVVVTTPEKNKHEEIVSPIKIATPRTPQNRVGQARQQQPNQPPKYVQYAIFSGLFNVLMHLMQCVVQEREPAKVRLHQAEGLHVRGAEGQLQHLGRGQQGAETAFPDAHLQVHG